MPGAMTMKVGGFANFGAQPQVAANNPPVGAELTSWTISDATKGRFVDGQTRRRRPEPRRMGGGAVRPVFDLPVEGSKCGFDRRVMLGATSDPRSRQRTAPRRPC
jgi:hypothetical protein